MTSFISIKCGDTAVAPYEQQLLVIMQQLRRRRRRIYISDFFLYLAN